MRTEQRKEFTVAWLDNVDPAPAGKREVWWDVRQSGLGVCGCEPPTSDKMPPPT